MKGLARTLMRLVVGAAFALSAGSAQAAVPWEVAVIFLGGREPPEFQRDIDQNILEFSQIEPGDYLRLSLLREFPEREVQYFSDAAGKPSWDKLFQEAPHPRIRRPGELASRNLRPGEAPLMGDPQRLGQFLARAFRNPAARRALIIYGHGLGYEGLAQVGLKELRARLLETLPARPKKAGFPVDLLWLDACFMATAEVAYELRSVTPLLVASEDAEFSAGALFDRLEILGSGPEDAVQTTIELARSFVDSYSFLKNGRQRGAVVSTSATISVVSTAAMERLAQGMGALSRALGQFTPEQRKRLQRRISVRQTEKPEQVDLGSLLVAIEKLPGISGAAQEAARSLLTLLEVASPERRRTAPHIELRPPRPDALIVYGYENWTRGFRGDDEVLSKLPSALLPSTYVKGGRRHEWPARPIGKRLYLSPYTVGLNRFDVAYLDPVTLKPLAEPDIFIRNRDAVAFTARTPENPILFTGYTQGMGNSAERYTGLGILDPSLQAAGLDYLDLDFAVLTGWAGL